MKSVPSAQTGTESPGIRTRMTVPVLAFGGILMAVMQTVVVPLLPDLPRLTGSSPAAVSWMVTATLLTGAVLTPVLGRAGDMYGKRRVLLLALALMTGGSVLCALTADIRLLIAARALQGAAAAVVPLSISILRDELPPARTGSAVALMSSTVGIGAALGLPLAALIVQYSNWHMMFWATSGLGALGLALAWWAVRESPVRSPGRFDTLGAFGLAAGLVSLLLAVQQGGQWGWGSPRILGLFGGCAVIMTLWWRQQLRTTDPLVDLRLAARPRVALPHLAALLAGFAFYANSLVTAQLVQAPTASGYGLGLSIVGGGLCLLPNGIVMLLFSPVSARISAARGATDHARPRRRRDRPRLCRAHRRQPGPVGDRRGRRGRLHRYHAGVLGPAHPDPACGAQRPDRLRQRCERPDAHHRAGGVQRLRRRVAGPAHDAGGRT